MAKVYTYDEETHTHRIGGEVVPGITTCIKPLTSYDAIPPAVLQAACNWGTAVHKTVELFCKGTLDEDQLDPALIAVLTGFDRWADEIGILPCDFVVETPMGDPSLMYAGIPDLILDGKLIVEIKTRPVNMLTDSIQTAAQEAIWKKNGGIRTKEYERRVLELKQDGTYVYTKVNHRQAWPRFRMLLDHYWNTEKIQSWKESK